MSKRWARFFYTQGKIVAALAAMVLLGKSYDAEAAQALWPVDSPLLQGASSSAFAPGVADEDSDEVPPMPE